MIRQTRTEGVMARKTRNQTENQIKFCAKVRPEKPKQIQWAIPHDEVFTKKSSEEGKREVLKIIRGFSSYILPFLFATYLNSYCFSGFASFDDVG